MSGSTMPLYPVSQENWDEIPSFAADSFSLGFLGHCLPCPIPQVDCIGNPGCLCPLWLQHGHLDVKVKTPA